ncbi:MAG: DUF2510 domain-containing protein [Dermatophilaceae bacterium]
MSAPPGWHPQPDGRERFWDGTQWTDQFRTPAPPTSVPPAAAPPPPPSWASPEPTQAIDIDRTQALPTPDPAGAAPPSGPVSGGEGAPGAAPPWQPAGYDATAGQPAGQPAGTTPGASPPAGPVAPGTGYGTPGTPWQPPPQKNRSRGCLIAAIVTAVVLVVVVAVAIWAVFAVGRTVVETVESNVPSNLPTNLPTDLPTNLPTDLPTAAPFDIEVGEGFELPRAEVAGGWTLSETSNLGARVQGMRATFRQPTQVPAVFSLSFTTAGGDTLETACTSQVGGDEVTEADVSCIPIFGDVSGVESVRVTPGF